jgi:RNase P/RNase MRP subunit POP5
MRSRKRYLLYRVECEAPVSETQVKHASYAALLDFLGEYGSSLAAPKFIGFNQRTGAAVLKCAHTETEKVKAALALCPAIEGKRAALRLLKVSGTIKSLAAGLPKPAKRR